MLYGTAEWAAGQADGKNKKVLVRKEEMMLCSGTLLRIHQVAFRRI
jgi:hypothetical protein